MELFQAVAEGDEARVQELLAGKSRSIVNRRGPNKSTPLIAAAMTGNLEIARTLIDAGARLDLQDADYQTALMHAICQGNDAIVDLLLKAGARADVENWLAFDFAVRFGKPSLVKRFVKMGADVNRRDDDDPTLLMEAIARGNMEIVHLLLDAGADPALTAEGGQTALSLAAERGNTQLFNLLLEAGCPVGPALAGAVFARNTVMARKLIELGADVNAKDDQFSYSLLSTATNHGDAKMVRVLLKAGADVESTDWMGQTPLWTAAVNGYARVARILLDAEANLNVRDENGETLIQAVTWMGAERSLDLLLKRGADPNAVGGRSPAALLWAAGKDSVPMTRMLLKAGADPNVALPKMKQEGFFEGCAAGTTALMIAARNGQLEILELLLAAGADPLAKNSKGQTAAEFAAQAGHANVLSRLESEGAGIKRKSKRLQNAILLRATETGDLNGVKDALQAGARPDITQQKRGTTPLMQAALDGHTAIVSALLDAGADPNQVSKWEETPLRNAVVRGHTEVVRMLLNSGADANVSYAAGSVPSGEKNTVITSLESPLSDAAYLGRDEILELLLKAGADVNLTAASGTSPLLAAVYGQHHGLARRLLEAGARPRDEDADYLAVLAWEEAAREPAYRDCVVKVEEACGVKAEPLGWLPGAQSFRLVIPEPGKGQNAEPADQTEAIMAWSKQWNRDYTALVKQIDDVLREVTGYVAERGCHLIDAGMPLGCGPMTRFMVLLPTDDKYAILAAFGTRGNDMELNNRDIIAWFRALDAVQPFKLRGCKFDTVSIELDQPFDDPKAWAVKLCDFCPDSYDRGEMKTLCKQLCTTTKLTFWWD